MFNSLFRGDEQGGSFLPQDYVQRKTELRANIICLTLFGVVMFGIVGAFFVTNRQWLQVKDERQAITVEYTRQAARIEQLKNLEGQKAEMMAKAEVTTALIERVPRSILMVELVTRMPDEMALLELNLTSQRIREPVRTSSPTQTSGNNQIRTLSGAGNRRPQQNTQRQPERIAPPRFEYTLRLTGVARANTHIADYLAALNACALLENVELKHIRSANIDGTDFRRFEIEAQLRRDADARGIESAPEIRQAMETSSVSEQAEENESGSGAVTTVTPSEGGQ